MSIFLIILLLVAVCFLFWMLAHERLENPGEYLNDMEMNYCCSDPLFHKHDLIFEGEMVFCCNCGNNHKLAKGSRKRVRTAPPLPGYRK